MPNWSERGSANGKGDGNRANLKKYSAGYKEINWNTGAKKEPVDKEIWGLLCKKCGSKIRSKHVHDFVWCKCKSIAVDGGREYLKITGNQEDMAFIYESDTKI